MCAAWWNVCKVLSTNPQSSNTCASSASHSLDIAPHFLWTATLDMMSLTNAVFMSEDFSVFDKKFLTTTSTAHTNSYVLVEVPTVHQSSESPSLPSSNLAVFLFGVANLLARFLSMYPATYQCIPFLIRKALTLTWFISTLWQWVFYLNAWAALFRIVILQGECSEVETSCVGMGLKNLTK